MIKKISIGIVVFRQDGKSIKYLLLHHGGEYWNFPKGTQKKGESDLDTALRELKEETGIKKIKLIDGFMQEYDYDLDTEIKNGVREKIYKHVKFFLGQVQDDKIKISHEHLDSGWFDYETALKRMYYQDGQNLLKTAHQYILKMQDFVL